MMNPEDIFHVCLYCGSVYRHAEEHLSEDGTPVCPHCANTNTPMFPGLEPVFLREEGGEMP